MSVDAIYLLTPTAQNVDRVIADFTLGRRTYKAAHLYFIDGTLVPSSAFHHALCCFLDSAAVSDVVQASTTCWRRSSRTHCRETC
jgi:hypothetical protein